MAANEAPQSAASTTLLDLLSNPIISDGLIPYLDLQSIFRLARVARDYRETVLSAPRTFRYLDLSKCKGAFTPYISRIDNGGHSWRAERMDENLTEDEFYAGPLRYVLGRLEKLKVLQHVQVLVLDELASVTNDILHELLTSGKYVIRLLSIRQCLNVNQSKLQQLLTYLCRPSRPDGTPSLKGLYVFTDSAAERARKDAAVKGTVSEGVTTNDGATLGMFPRSAPIVHSANWYTPAGRLVQQGASSRTSWEETLQTCKGIIAFDAVLCSSMHTAMSTCLHDASREFLSADKPGTAPLATMALGTEGCSGCGKAPEGTPIWGKSDNYDFPLVSPPPSSGRLVDALRPSSCSASSVTLTEKDRRLIVSCTWCMTNRHCDSCHKWWCAECFDPKKSNTLRALANVSDNDLASLSDVPSSSSTAASSVKDGPRHHRHHHYLPLSPGQPAVTRACWDCGRVCAECASRSARICKFCKSEYCVWHNDGCDEKTCDWCMYRSGRSTRELY